MNDTHVQSNCGAGQPPTVDNAVALGWSILWESPHLQRVVKRVKLPVCLCAPGCLMCLNPCCSAAPSRGPLLGSTRGGSGGRASPHHYLALLDSVGPSLQAFWKCESRVIVRAAIPT